ncbi:MAG TPA: hypothetical protein VGM59_15870 [Dongiaceae bacterium]
MSKGNQKSNRETKKPKKSAAEKAKGGGSAYKQSLSSGPVAPSFGKKK